MLALLLGVNSVASPAAAGSAPASDGQFCSRAQQIITGTSLVARNLDFERLEDFIRSKPRVEPFETDQYVTRIAGQPHRVSCKMKSADHLREVYGPPAAREESDCRAVNRDTVERVFKSLSDADLARLAIRRESIVLEPDVVASTGASFTKGSDRLWVASTGRLHIQALAIRVDWLDWRWRWMPDRFRGQHSCHLVAPERLLALVFGEQKPPPGP